MDKNIKLFIIAQVAIISLFTVLDLSCTPKEWCGPYKEDTPYGQYTLPEHNTSIEDSNNDTIMIVDDFANAEDIKI